MDNHVEKLIKIGLTVYEAKTYYSLLQKNELTATEISKLAGVPRTRVYEVLNNLTQKGFCSTIPGKVRKFKAISPQFAFDDYLQDMEKTMESRKKEIAHISDTLTPIYEMEKDNNESLEYAYIVKERNLVNEKINDLGEKASKEIVTMNKAPYAVNIPQLIERGYVQSIKGLNYKFISEESDLKDPQFLKFMQLWQESGAQIRIVKEVPVKLVIFDKKSIILSLPDKIKTTPQYTSMVIEHEDLASFFLKIFDIYFQEGIELDDYINKNKELS